MRLTAVPLFIWLAFLGAITLSVSCGEGRFPVCKSNEDCNARDAGPAGKVCVDLKCVECQYDNDCPAGKVCNRRLGECEGLGSLGLSSDGGTAP